MCVCLVRVSESTWVCLVCVSEEEKTVSERVCVCLVCVSESTWVCLVCVSEEEVGRSVVGRSVGRRAVGRSAGAAPKVRTPHNDVGNNNGDLFPDWTMNSDNS